MFALIAFSSIVLLSYVLHHVTYRKRNLAFATFPTLKKYFIVHNTLSMLTTTMRNLLEKIEKWETKLGQVFLISLHPFHCGFAFINDPNIAEAVSLHQPDRSRAFLYKTIGKWIGDGFFLSPMEKSKKLLKPLWIAFNPKNHHKYATVINKNVNGWLDGIKAENQDRVEIPHIFAIARLIVLDITFDTLFNYSIGLMAGRNRDYVSSITKFSKIAMVELFDIRPRLGFFYRFTQLYRGREKHLKIIKDFTNKMVKDRRRKVEDGTITKDDFILDYYFMHKLEGRDLSDEEIAREIDTMILGTHDTTQNAFGFILFHLAKYPEAQQKVFEEAYAILKDDPKRDLTEEDVDNLPYIENVIKETLRIFPPIPFIGRKLQSEITVGEYTFPRDVEVIISPYLICRNPKYFEDPLEFKPERFIGVEPLPLAFTPFSIGAKKCIGGKMAMLGLKLAMSKVIWDFKLSLPKGREELKIICEVVLATEENVPIIFERRQHA